MTFPKVFFSRSPEETADVAKLVSSLTLPSRIINLVGDLGVGKTFFVKKYCEVFEILNVSSPTFALVNQYSNGKTIYHFDFYRIETAEEIIDYGFTDYMNDESSLCFIEWGNRFPELLPKKRVEINFSIAENFNREIAINFIYE